MSAPVLRVLVVQKCVDDNNRLSVGVKLARSLSHSVGSVKLQCGRKELPMAAAASPEAHRPAAPYPLRHIRVLSIEKLLPAPFCSRLLADLGASVTRVTDPSFPDLVESFPPVGPDRKSFLFHALNHGKHEIAGHFQDAAFQRRLIHEILRDFDVLIINMKPGTFESIFQLGDISELWKLYPKLIVVVMSAYSLFPNPLQSLPGHDLNCVARAGLLSVPAVPQLPPTYMADLMCAWSASLQVVSLLVERERNPETFSGSLVDASMLAGAASCMFLQYAASMNSKAADEFGTHGRAVLHGGVPNYEVYECKDGQFVAVGTLEPALWARLLVILDLDKHPSVPANLSEYASAPSKVAAAKFIVQRRLREKTADEWEQQCARARLPVDRIRTPGEAATDHAAIFEEMGLVREVYIAGRKFRLPRTPVGVYYHQSQNQLHSDETTMQGAGSAVSASHRRNHLPSRL